MLKPLFSGCALVFALSVPLVQAADAPYVYTESAAAPSDAHEQQIASLFERWNAALQIGDSAKVAALYADNGVLQPTVSNRVRVGHEAIQDYFEMDPKQMSAIEERVARTAGIEVLGYYHSHPDHPAKPSPRDLDAAQQVYLFARIRYSYVILSCMQGKVIDVTSSVLAEDEQAFVPEALLSDLAS